MVEPALQHRCPVEAEEQGLLRLGQGCGGILAQPIEQKKTAPETFQAGRCLDAGKHSPGELQVVTLPRAIQLDEKKCLVRPHSAEM